MPVVNCSGIDNIIWRSPAAGSFILRETSVDIWRIAVSTNIQRISELRNILIESELERASRYYQEKDRNRFVISRAMLRYLLGTYLDQPAEQIQIARGVNKKPFVQNARDTTLHYNTTHAGDWILMAIAKTEVGVDVEKIENNFMYNEVLQLYFSQQEIDFIKKAPHPVVSFFSLWTRKEVLLKATAKGLDDDLQNIPCLDGTHRADPKIIGSDEAWTVNSFEMGNEYTASIAYNPRIQHLSFYHVEDYLIEKNIFSPR